MNWKLKLTNIYNLASLHSWINQIDDMIIDFLTDVTDNQEKIKYLIEDLKSEKFSTEHDIISIVLLNYFEHPVLQIIDLADEKLYGKISKNDINFLKKHLFSGILPLSSDLSYDITNRSFLSPKKAIQKAMQIDTVLSRENPHLTVLYMCFILSRIDMNEENRAIAAFLLLRIDIDLPPGLQSRVYKYLWKYKDIIQELLEEEGDGPVILENIKNLKEKISSVKIVEAKKESTINVSVLNQQSPLIKINNRNTRSVIEVRKKSNGNDQGKITENTETTFFIEKKDNISVPKHTKNKAAAKAVENKIVSNKNSTNTSKTPGNENKFQFDINTEKESNPLTVIKESRLKHKSDKKDSLAGVSKQSLLNRKGSNTPEVNNIIDNSKPDEPVENGIKFESQKPDTIDKKTWSINLKKSKDILESILNGIFQKSTSAKDVKKLSNIVSKKSKSNVSNSNILIIIKYKKLLMGLGVLIILGLSIYFAAGKYTNYNSAELKKMNETAPEADTTGKSENLIDKSNLNISGTSKLSENTPSIIPADFPFSISAEGNNLIWEVAKGDSITGLFYALKDYQTELIGTPLEKLSNMDWITFFNNFKKHNPERKSYHIIFPTEIFILSLN